MINTRAPDGANKGSLYAMATFMKHIQYIYVTLKFAMDCVLRSTLSFDFQALTFKRIWAEQLGTQLVLQCGAF